MKKRKISLLDQIMIGLLSVIVAGFLAYFFYANTLTLPIEKNRSEIVQIAKDKAGLTKIISYNLVTTDKTYYSLTGTDSSANKIAVLIPQDSEEIRVINLAEGVAQASLPQKDAVTIDLALYKGNPVWEVNTKTDFKIYDFKTGKEV